MGRFRGLRPDESLLERRRSPDGPDRPLGLRRSGQPDVRRHARNARPRDLHQRDGQLLRRMAGHRGAETHRPPRHRRKAQRRRRILSGQAFEIRHLGLRKHEHAAAQRLLPARQRQEQRHFGRSLRQLRQKLGQALPLRQRRGPDRRKHVQRLPALRRGIPQQPDGRHHLRPAVRPGQKARRHLVDHARNQFPGNRVVQLRRPLQRRPHVPRKRLVALRRRQPLVVGMERRRGVEPPQRTLPARSGRFETIQDPRLGRTDGQPELRHQRSAGHLSLLYRGHLPRTDGRLPLEDAQPRPQMGTAHGLQRGRRHYGPPRNDRLRLLQLGDREHAHRRGDPHLHGFRHREGQPGQGPQPRHRGQIELYALAGQTGLFQPLRLDRL